MVAAAAGTGSHRVSGAGNEVSRGSLWRLSSYLDAEISRCLSYSLFRLRSVALEA